MKLFSTASTTLEPCQKKKKKAKQSTATCTVALVSAIPSPIRDPMSRLENFSSSSGHSHHFFLLRHKRMNDFAFLQYAHTAARPACCKMLPGLLTSIRSPVGPLLGKFHLQVSTHSSQRSLVHHPKEYVRVRRDQAVVLGAG
jgi:hypothetical protein